VNVPEDPFAVLIKRACSEHSGNIGSGHPDSVPPAMRYRAVRPDSRYVLQGDFQRTFERPQFVGSPDVQNQPAIGNG
jgi:hypothetical protein